jgi:hypothetical protein
MKIGSDLPYPDKAGLWPFGFTRIEVAMTPFYLITYLGKEYQKDFSRFPKGIRVFAVFIRDELLKKALRYHSLKLFQKEIVDEFGWSELNALTKLRKQMNDENNFGWRVWTFERDVESALQQVEGWVESGHSWSGRDLFIRGQQNG